MKKRLPLFVLLGVFFIHVANSQTPYPENVPITDLPPGVSYQRGPGNNNSIGWTYPFGTKLVVNSGAARNFEFLVTDKSSSFSKLMFRQFYQITSSWGNWREIIVANESGHVGIGIQHPTHSFHLESVLGQRARFKFGATIIDLPSYGSGSTAYANSAGLFVTGTDGLVMSGQGHHLRFITNNGDYVERMRITDDGNIGIGTTTPNEKLSVNGHIRAKAVKVEASNWPDYVFADDYELSTLKEVKNYIQAHKHLPGIPTEADVLKDGVNLGEINAKLLEKIEELTLYLITQDEELTKLQNELQALKKLFNTRKSL